MAKVNPDVVPKTLDEAVQILREGLDAADIAHIQAQPPESVHFGLGMGLRNGWSLWDREMPLHQWFRRELRIGHADDMSGLILTKLWCTVRGEPFDLAAEVARYHAHWQAAGHDPMVEDC